MKPPKGYNEKPAYKVTAHKSKKTHDSIVKTVSNVPEGPPLPPPTADELRELYLQVDQNKTAESSATALTVIVPRLEKYSTIAQWRAGPVNDSNEERDAWERRGEAVVWDLNLLLLDQIEKVKVFIINRVTNSEKDLIQNFEPPFPRWWIYLSQLKRELKARNAYAPLKNGCDALSDLIEAYYAAIGGDFRQANIKTIHGLAHWSICVVQQYEHEIILGREQFERNRDIAHKPRQNGLSHIFEKLKTRKKAGFKPKELWSEFIDMLTNENQVFDNVVNHSINRANPQSWSVNFVIIPNNDDKQHKEIKMSYARFVRRLNEKKPPSRG